MHVLRHKNSEVLNIFVFWYRELELILNMAVNMAVINLLSTTAIVVYTVWVKKSPLRTCGNFSKTLGWEFFNQILHAYYAFQSTLDYKFLFSYLQLWPSYDIFSATRPPRHAFRSMVDILSTWWSRLIWHNIVKVAVTWIQICSPA